MSTLIWISIQTVLFQVPDLSKYNLDRNKYLDFRNRLVSFIHGILCLLLSSYVAYLKFSSCGDATTQLEYFILTMSGGYFSYDFISMAFFGLLDLDMAIHHLMCIGGIVMILIENKGASFVVNGLFVAEVSNPAMHCRVMLRYMGLRYSRAYEVAEYTYFIMFFFGRVILGHPVTFNTVSCEDVNNVAKFVALGVMAQSYLFLYRMYFIVRARVAEQAERNKRKIKISWFEPIPIETLKECKFYQKSKTRSEKLP